MTTINCYNCKCENSNESKFCKECGSQLTCKKCESSFEQGAKFCSSCGEATNSNSLTENRAINTFEYTQKGNSKSLKTNFTDEVGAFFASTINSFVSGQPIPQKNPFQRAAQLPAPKNLNNIPNKLPDTSNIFQDADVIETDYADAIAKIFKENSEGRLEVNDNRLKEKSNFDKVKRVTVLFLYAQKLRENESTSREDLNSLVTQQKLKLEDFRKFLSTDSKKFFSQKENGSYTLLAGGEDYAKEILEQISNPDYKIVASKAGRKAGKKTSNSASKNDSTKGSSSKSSALDMCNSLIKEDYFSSKKKLNDIVQYCIQKKATTYSPQGLNYALSRLIKNGTLDREKNNESQYEYWKK